MSLRIIDFLNDPQWLHGRYQNYLLFVRKRNEYTFAQFVADSLKWLNQPRYMMVPDKKENKNEVK